MGIWEKIDIYRNYQYAIYFDFLGFRCGYIKVPENSKIYGKFFDDIYLNSVQLTFSGHIKSLSGWFIGWDHCHLWDGIDRESIRNYNSNCSDEEIKKLIEHAEEMAGDQL